VPPALLGRPFWAFADVRRVGSCDQFGRYGCRFGIFLPLDTFIPSGIWAYFGAFGFLWVFRSLFWVWVFSRGLGCGFSLLGSNLRFGFLMWSLFQGVPVGARGQLVPGKHKLRKDHGGGPFCLVGVLAVDVPNAAYSCARNERKREHPRGRASL